MPHFQTAFWSSHILSHFSSMLSFFLFSFTYCRSLWELSFSSASFLPKGTDRSCSRSLCSFERPFRLDYLKAAHVKQTSAVREQIQWGCNCESPSLKFMLFCFICVYRVICGSNMCLDYNKMFGKEQGWYGIHGSSCTGNDGAVAYCFFPSNRVISDL